MANKAVYNLESINKVIELMDKELSVSGIQNIKTIANIHEILANDVEVINDEPAAAPEELMVPTEATAQEIYNADDDFVEVDEASETVEDPVVVDGPVDVEPVEVDADDDCNDGAPC